MNDKRDTRDEPVELPPGKARQGTGSPRILILLVVSLLLALVYWWGVDLYREIALAPDEPAQEPATTQQPTQQPDYPPSSPVLPDESLQRSPD